MKKLLAAIMLMTTNTVWAGDYEDGVAAFERKDYATAVEKFTSAAEQGDASAQNTLGVMYDQGLGVSQDYAEAARWYMLAAEQGHAIAQFNIGKMYNVGLGVTQDYAQAVRWYMLAAEQGIASAQFLLAFMYSEGQGVTQDYVKAHMWLNLAAAQGHEAAKKGRNQVAKQLTPTQIAEAQKLAGECRARDYKNCD